jgi:RNA polymerase sigma factor (sigma-70 family)
MHTSTSLTNQQTNDVILWVAFQEGDADALGKLVRRHYNALLQYARKFSRDEDLIADCIQNVLLRVWDTRHRLTVPTNVKYYLLGSVRHAVVEAVRGASVLEHDYEWETHTADATNVEADWIRQEADTLTMQQLKDNFEKLPPRQREALYLRYYEDLSYSEISQLMGITSQSVANALQIALQKLRAGWHWATLTGLVCVLY